MRYVSVRETNQLIRKALKEAFPGVKFRVVVRGGSTYIHWKDGPAYSRVRDVVAPFEGRSFDAMSDYAYTRTAVMDGEEVCFEVGYVFLQRTYSPAFLKAAYEYVTSRYAFDSDPPPADEAIQVWPAGDASLKDALWYIKLSGDSRHNLRDMVAAEAAGRDEAEYPGVSPLAQSIQVAREF